MLKRLIGIPFLLFLVLAGSQATQAQCAAGYTSAQLNWDVMDFLSSTSAGYTAWYSVATFPFSQNFAVGPRNLNIAVSPTSSISLNGENATNTAHLNSFATAGDDVQFTTSTTSNRVITLTFDVDVDTVRFSLFDLDNAQKVTITALDGLGAAKNITVTKANVASAIIITGSGTATGTINIKVHAPVKTITITLSTANGDIWLSDIGTCVTGSFPVNYFAGMQPYTGQPTYIIATSDTNTVSLINVATGQAQMIFQDASSPRYINGLGYDHIKNDLYYVTDFTSSPSTNFGIKKYNFNTQVISTVAADVRTIGIPTFNRGVESAGCAFYDGALYFGVEGNGSNGRENIIWRIDFDASGNVTGTRQAWATVAQTASTQHDWGDFAIIDSVLIDFNSAANVRKYTHYNLHTEQVVATYTAVATNPPKQTGVTWNNGIYWVYDSIAVYNMNGTIGPLTKITGATVLDWVGFCGDATGFRPQSDFGDAPASYDPVALSPALHMRDTILRLGAAFDQEFVKSTSALADGDGIDEDAIATVTVLDTATTNYINSITVYNNTGSDATLIGWLDINGNGIFDPSEGRSVTVPTSTSVQTVNIAWNGINTPLISGQTTFLRIRLTSTSFGMTVNNPTGFYSNGEVEDYRVFVSAILPVNLTTFGAIVLNNNKVKLDWTASDEVGLREYEVQRSINSTTWEPIGFVSAKNQSGQVKYTSWDYTPLQGRTYYRLRIVDNNNNSRFSQLAPVTIKGGVVDIVVFPNPVDKTSVLRIEAGENAEVKLKIYNENGAELSSYKVIINAGENKIPLETERLPNGIYMLRVEISREVKTTRFIKK
jgi:hypothetical protein